MTATRILLVEDERRMAEVLEYALRHAGYALTSAATLREARQVIGRGGIDLLILDLGLPDGDGLDLCRELRRRSSLPILIVSSRVDEVDRVLGLEIGADDYVVKPFSPRELVARVRALLRRSQAVATASEPLCRGRVEVDRSSHRVLLDGREVRTTPTELELLATLMSQPQRVFTREVLIAEVYDGNSFLSDRTIDSHVKGLRRRFSALDPGADPVETVFGVGYRLRVLP
jgi:DNA-binding response OmpR family regulator